MKAVAVVLTIFLLLYFFLPVKDTDFGWHYRCGKEFLESGKLCLTNEYSYFLPGFRSYLPYFLYDISLAFTFDRWGFVGVSLLGSLVFTSAFLLLFAIVKTPLWLGSLSLVLVALVEKTVFPLGYRSQILGLLFFTATLLVLDRLRNADLKKLLFLLPLFFLWANSHPSFFLGPMMLAVYALCQIVKTHAKAFPLSLVLAISVLSTFGNPFGWRIYGEIFRHGQSPLGAMIAEWVPPGPWHIALILGTGLVTAILIYQKKASLLDYRVWLLIVFSAFAVLARRNLPFFYFTLVYFFFHIPEISLLPFRIKPLPVILILLGLSVFSLGRVANTIRFDTNWQMYCNSGLVPLPCFAIEKLKKLNAANLYTMYEWGGFLIWKVPKIKVFADGRMPAWQDDHGKSPYQVFLEIIQTQPGWNQQLRAYNTSHLLITRGSFLDLALQKDTNHQYGWIEEYKDDLAVIYKRID